MSELATQDVARARAAQIRAGIQNYLHTLANVAAAYQQRDWKALGYDSWDSYVDGEYGADRLKLSAEHRQKAVAELRLAGMSMRAIGSAVGVDEKTVRNDLRGAEFSAPDEIQGADGKTYASTRPTAAEGSVPSADGADDDDAPRRPATAGAPDVHAAPARPGPVEGSPGPGRVTPNDSTGDDLGPVDATGGECSPVPVAAPVVSEPADTTGVPDEPVRVRLYVDTGFSGAEHDDVLLIDRAQWNAWTPAERRNYLSDAARTLMENHIEYGWLIKDDEDYADTEDAE